MSTVAIKLLPEAVAEDPAARGHALFTMRSAERVAPSQNGRTIGGSSMEPY